MTSEPASQLAEGARIWVICGNACAGKTATARLLAQRLPPAAHVDGDEMQRLIVSGCRWPVPSDSDPGTGRLTGEAGAQYALRIRNACLVAAAFADAGITAIVTDAIINEGFESLTEVLGGRSTSSCSARPWRCYGSAGVTGCPKKPRTWRTATATQITPRRRRSPAGSKPQPTAGRSTSLRKSSNGASIVCRRLDFGLIPVASIRRVWWIFC
jgi:hypothetical protein